MIYFEETDSTNLRAKDAAANGAEHGTLFVAERQSAGRGRRGRNWESPAGANIYMSLLLRPAFAPEKASMLTLVMAVAVAEAIRKTTGICTGIKWPNDIVLHGKKVCGILTEMSAKPGEIEYVVIGVGINVNSQKFPDDLAKIATSLGNETEDTYDRTALISAVEKEFFDNYEQFLKTEDLSGLQEFYNNMLVNRGRQVRVLEPGNAYEAVAERINESGELLVVTPDGAQKRIYAGEVSVRGIYGYT